MTWVQIGWLVLGLFLAVIAERSCHAVLRRIKENKERLVFLIHAQRQQRAALERLLARDTLSSGLRRFVLGLSRIVEDRDTALKFAAWMDRGEPKPEVVPCERRLEHDWQGIRARDPETARLIISYVNLAALIMLWKWNETLRSASWLSLDIATGDQERAPMHRAALIEHAAETAKKSQRRATEHLEERVA